MEDHQHPSFFDLTLSSMEWRRADACAVLLLPSTQTSESRLYQLSVLFLLFIYVLPSLLSASQFATTRSPCLMVPCVSNRRRSSLVSSNITTGITSPGGSKLQTQHRRLSRIDITSRSLPLSPNYSQLLLPQTKLMLSSSSTAFLAGVVRHIRQPLH
jgi:hypothetical protein